MIHLLEFIVDWVSAVAIVARLEATHTVRIGEEH